ncbi:MAG: PKD domain-containing protein [Thermodesulfobacteriota bacterium]
MKNEAKRTKQFTARILLSFLLYLFVLPSVGLAGPDDPKQAVDLVTGTPIPVARLVAGGQVHLSWDDPDAFDATKHYAIYGRVVGSTAWGNPIINDINRNALGVGSGIFGSAQRFYTVVNGVDGKEYEYAILSKDAAGNVFGHLVSNPIKIDVSSEEIYFYLNTDTHGGIAEFYASKDSNGNPINGLRVAKSKMIFMTNTTKVYVDSSDWYSNLLQLPSKISNIITRLDNDVYPKVTEAFGSPTDIDGDNLITLYMDDFPGEPGLNGYFFERNMETTAVTAASHHREMIYINYNIDVDKLAATYAHELQHLIHYGNDPNELLWINEGASVLAEDVAGYFKTYWGMWCRSVDQFVIGNNAGAPIFDDYGNSCPDYEDTFNYGVAGAWAMYMHSVLPKEEYKKYITSADSGPLAFSSVLSPSQSYYNFFADWAITNYLNPKNHEKYQYKATTPWAKYGKESDNLTTMRVEPIPYKDNFILDVVKQESDLNNLTYNELTVDALQAVYFQWTSTAAAPGGGILGIRLRGVKDLPDHYEVALVQEYDNGTIKVNKKDASGPIEFQVDDFGTDFQKVTLIINNADPVANAKGTLVGAPFTCKIASYILPPPKVASITLLYKDNPTDSGSLWGVGVHKQRMEICFDQEMNRSISQFNDFFTIDPQGPEKGFSPRKIELLAYHYQIQRSGDVFSFIPEGIWEWGECNGIPKSKLTFDFQLTYWFRDPYSPNFDEALPSSFVVDEPRLFLEGEGEIRIAGIRNFAGSLLDADPNDPGNQPSLQTIYIDVTRPDGPGHDDMDPEPECTVLGSRIKRSCTITSTMCEDWVGNNGVFRSGQDCLDREIKRKNPDDNYSLSDSTPPPFTPDPSAEIAILGNGLFLSFSSIMNDLGVPYALATLPLSLDQLRQYRVLVIPSAGFKGLEDSESFKSLLQQYVEQGGVIFSMSQDRGYEFDVLPGSWGGAGYSEEEGCVTYAGTMESRHPIFAGQADKVFDANADGYFSAWPDGATVLSRRVKNSMPMLVEYPLGRGKVLASTLFSDYGHLSNQINDDEKILIRDILQWGLNGQEVVHNYDVPFQWVTPLNILELFPVANFSQTETAVGISMELISPTGVLLTTLDKNLNTPLGPLQIDTVGFTHTLPQYSPVGIYRLRYQLKDAAGNPIGEQNTLGRFAVSFPGLTSTPATGLRAVLRPASTVIADGASATFDVIVFNDTDQDSDITLDYGFKGIGSAEFVWTDGVAEYKSPVPIELNISPWYDLCRVGRAGTVCQPSPEAPTLTPGSVPAHDSRVFTIQIPTVKNHGAILPTLELGHRRETNSKLSTPFFGDPFVRWLTDTNEVETPFKVKINGTVEVQEKIIVFTPTVATEVSIDKAEYLPAETGTVSFSIANRTSGAYEVTAHLQVLDPDYQLLLDTTEQISLTPNSSHDGQLAFAAGNKGGGYIVLLEVYETGGTEKIGSASTSFTVPDGEYFSLTPQYPATWIVGGSNPVSFQLASLVDWTIPSGTVATTLYAPDGQVVWTSSRDFADLGGGATLDFADTVPLVSVIPGSYRMKTVVSALSQVREYYADFLNEVVFVPATDKTFYRMRDTVQLTVEVINNGVFEQDVNVEYAIPSFGLAQTASVHLVDTASVAAPILVPDTISGGRHDLTVALAGGQGEKTLTLTVQAARLALRADQAALGSGDVLTVSVDNTGGVDADFDLSLEFYDAAGVLIASTYGSGSATAGGTATDMITVPVGAVSGTYSLFARCTDPTTGSELASLNKRIALTGIAGSLQVATGQKSYHPGDAMHILSTLEKTAGQSIDGASLQLKVYGNAGACTPPPPPAGDADPSMIPDLQLCNSGSYGIELWPYENGPTESHRTLVLVNNVNAINGNDYTLRSAGLTALNIPYDLKAISYLASPLTELAQYTHILIPGDGTSPTFRATLDANMDKLTAWVEAGGHLYFSASCAYGGPSGFQCWASGPGGLTSTATSAISHSYENYIQTPQHPIVEDLTNSDLQGWIHDNFEGGTYQYWVSTAHFTDLPPNTVTILSDDPAGLQPTMIEYPLGSGRVVASTNNFPTDGRNLLYGWLAYRNLDWKISNVDAGLLRASFDPTNGILTFNPRSTSLDYWSPVYGSDQVKLTFTDSNNQSSSTWITVSVLPTLPSGVVLWEQTLPVDLVGPLELDTSFDISQSKQTGKFLVEGTLLSSLGQVIARDIDSFYVIDSDLGVTLETDKEVYVPGEQVLVTATVTNNTGVAETGLNFILTQAGVDLINQLFDLAPGATRTFTAQTGDAASFELTAAVKDVRFTDTVRVEEPIVYMYVTGPSAAGNDPFEISVQLDNGGDVAASLVLDFAGEPFNLILPAGSAEIFSRTFTITGDTSFAITLGGDVSLSETKMVSYGFLPTVLLQPQPMYPPGTVSVPFTVDNNGALGGALDLSFTLTGDGGSQLPAVQRTVFVEGNDRYSDTLNFRSLAPGSYRLTVDTAFAAGSVSFSVAPFDAAVVDKITIDTSLQADGTLPVTVAVRNTGANNFIGELQLFTGFYLGGQQVSIDAGQSREFSFSIPAPAAGNFNAKAALRFNQVEINSLQQPFDLMPQFDFVSLPDTPLWQAGQHYELVFPVANSGPVGGRVTLDLSGSGIGCQGSQWLAPGEQRDFTCQVWMPEDILSASQEAVLSLWNRESGTSRSELFAYVVEGYDLQVAIATDKPCYLPGDTAEVTLAVANNSGNALAGEALVSMNDYYSKQPVLFGGRPESSTVDLHSSPGDILLQTRQVLDVAQAHFDSNYLTLSGGTGAGQAWTYDQNGDIWVMYTTTKNLSKFDGTTGALIKNRVMSGNSWSSITQIAVDAAGNMYARGVYTNSIRVFDPETGTMYTEHQTPKGGTVAGVFWDGAYLWVGEYATTGKWFHRIDVSGGGWTVVNSFASPSKNVCYSIAVLGDTLLMSAAATDAFYFHTGLDYDTNTMSATYQTSADFGGGPVGSFAVKGDFLQRKHNTTDVIRNYVVFGSEFVAAGSYASNVLGLGLTDGAAITVDSAAPAGTEVILETRTGDTIVPDISWSDWQVQTSGVPITSPAASYLQYRLTLNSSDPAATPVVHSVSIEAPALVKPIVHTSRIDFESMPTVITNWVPVEFTGSKLFYGIYSDTGYAIHLNSIRLCESGQGLDIYPERQIYRPGETVTVHIQPHATGLLDLAGPGFGQTLDVQDTAAFSVDFVLPATMVQDTYPVTATFNGAEYATAIDVAGLALYFDMIMLDKKVYGKNDGMAVFAIVSASDTVTGVTAVGSVVANGLLYDSFEINGLSLARGVTQLQLGGAMPVSDNGFAQLYIDLYKEIGGDPRGMLLTAGVKAFDVVVNTAPSVTLLSPSGGNTLSGEQQISWTASDPENDALQYIAELSCDAGASWQPIYWLVDAAGNFSWDTTAIADAAACQLQIVVSDGEFVASDRSTPFAVANNLPPVAKVGVDQNTEVNRTVSLDGSDSFDPNFWDTIFYRWELTSIPAGSQLSSADIRTADLPKPTFVPDSEGDFVLTLTVTDRSGASSSASTTVSAQWAVVPPNADAGPDRNIAVGSLAELDGSASSDPDDFPAPLTYTWSLIGYPPGTVLTDADIVGADTALAGFTPDVPGIFSFNLRVFDGVAADNDQVTIFAEKANLPPLAAAGDDFGINLGDPAMLSGLASNDPDAAPTPLSYSWRFVSVPAGSSLTSADLVGPDTAQPSFVPDVAGEYVLELAVNDGAASAFDNVVVTVKNVAPTVNAGPDMTITLGDIAYFNGSFTGPGSADGHTSVWAFGDGTSATGTLTPIRFYGEVGTYTVTLTITDGDGGVGTDSLVVTVQPPAPSICGDIDGDGDVDVADRTALLASYRRCQGTPGYNPAADLDGDNCVTMADYRQWFLCYQAYATP